MDPNQSPQPLQPQPMAERPIGSEPQGPRPVAQGVQPTPVVNQPMAEIPQTPKGGSKIVPLLIVFIVVLVAGTAAYVFLNQNQTPKAPIEQFLPTAPPPTLTLIPTAEPDMQSLDTGDPTLDLQDIQTDLNQL